LAPPEDAADPLIGTEIGGHQVVSPQPEMGTGDNYLGVEPQSGLRVSIKVLPSRLSTDGKYTDRLTREIKLLEALDHERIAKIIGYGKTADRRHYLITEFLEGNSLQRLITREAPISPGRTLQLAEQILEALSGAHGVGVVHRDLKPTNIILLGQAGKRKVKLIDFALAKGGTSFDSPEYSAPENMRTAGPAPGSDLYSLGVVLFELLTGKLPFNAATPPELVKMHMLTPAPRVSETAPAVPRALDDLVAKLLAKSPEARGGPAEALRAQVLQILAELPDRPTGEQPRPEAVTAITAPGAPNFKHHESPTRKVEAEEIARVLEEPTSDDEKTAIAAPNEAGKKAAEEPKKPSEAPTRKLSADDELKKAAELLKATKKVAEPPAEPALAPAQAAPPPPEPVPAPAPASVQAAPPPPAPAPAQAAPPAPAPAPAPASVQAAPPPPAVAPAPVQAAPPPPPAPVQAAPPPPAPAPVQAAPQPPPPSFAPAPPRARAAPTPIPGDLLLPPLGAPPPAPVAAPEPKKPPPPRASPPTTVHLHDDEPPRSSKLPAIIGAAVVLMGLGIFAVLQLGSKPNPNSTGAVIAAAKSKPKEPEVPPPPPKKSAAELCTNLERWKTDAEDQLRIGARKYLRTAPSVKSPAMDALNAILADSRKVKTTEKCIEVQNAIESWESTHLAAK
jgi:serine/threonine protein kinase